MMTDGPCEEVKKRNTPSREQLQVETSWLNSTAKASLSGWMDESRMIASAVLRIPEARDSLRIDARGGRFRHKLWPLAARSESSIPRSFRRMPGHRLIAYTVLVISLGAIADAVKIIDIQGPSFQSPLTGQAVRNVSGVVTAKDKYGIWIQGEPSDDPRVSNGLRVYGHSILKSLALGDLISLSGTVAEYRAKTNLNDLLLTELENPHDIAVLSHNNTVVPLVLGKDRTPPTGQLSSADVGPEGWLSIPNNVTLLESLNATLRPDEFGLDFWESLEGQLVTIEAPVATNFPDRFGSIWVYGDWHVSGKNSRGGLTLTSSDPDAPPDAHPETILLGRPLDGTRNPKTAVGTALSAITGVVTYQFGSYAILPLTAPEVISIPNSLVAPSSLGARFHPCELHIGDYNVENMSPRSRHIPHVADHIAHYLGLPDIMLVQEIQDDSGVRNDGVVSANKTLTALVKAIAHTSNGQEYHFINVPPEDNMDGGQPGGNIRVAYLWNPNRVSLLPGSVIGNATQATAVIVDDKGELTMSLNPGRIDPTNAAWEEARKPLAAAWQTTSGDRFFTVNVHFSSKRGSSSAQGDARPPVNGAIDRRLQQVNVTATFIESLLARDANASVILAGDMNEYLQTRAVFLPLADLVTDINESSDVDPVERYTYAYDQHAQEIDHMFVSDAVRRRGTAVEHVHVNTWAATLGERASDHDPTVAKVWVCDSDYEVETMLSDDTLIAEDAIEHEPSLNDDGRHSDTICYHGPRHSPCVVTPNLYWTHVHEGFVDEKAVYRVYTTVVEANMQ
ncbi:hypothetical protein A0H81_07832 [Grifola frondosa]|uniref:Endonuclease/exonuclease/phosphatase domain-containing protein n=1 Tax=Grifola frondosa TaxID=5627 RepID=A0A1C7M6S1_GRIFR|nr:hypothetical protein A0H81_07832 [Grifola frondosa]